MTGALRIAIGLHILLAVALSFLPLFDGLGFERALATGLLAAVTSPVVTVSLIRRAQTIGPQGLPTVGRRALLFNGLLLLPSTLAGALVEALQQSCEPDAGLLFMVLVAGGNVLVGTALGSAAALVRFRPWAPFAGIAAVLIGALVMVVVGFYTEPQIFIYSAPWGYWPGSLYDEALAVDARLWAFRGYSTMAAGAVFALAAAFTDDQIRPTFRPRFGWLLAAVPFIAAAIWAYGKGPDIGWRLDREAVERALRTRVETDHFIIHVDPSVTAERLARIVEDHEHRYQQLKAFFEAEPDGKVVSFVYRNRSQKGRLMGASGTQIARPWAREIHIDGFNVPHRVLKHELAHIFAGAKATGPLKVPAVAGIFVNIGVVEGIAVAADWRVRELTVHGWTKAMQGLGLMPDLRESLDILGFWSISSSRAYTVAGSFLRYLVDTYGIDKFWTLYATNSFQRAYDRPLDALVTEWEAFLDRMPLPKDDLLIAEHRFKRPGIFQKVCAHVSANISARGYGRLRSGDVDGARPDLEQIYGYAPANPGPLIALAEAYSRAGRFDDAEEMVERALAAPGATLKGKTQAVEARANLAWRRGRPKTARNDYRVVLERHLSTPSDRLQQARMLALTRTSTAPTLPLLKAVLLGDAPSNQNLVRLAEASVRRAEDRLVHYLYARALERVGAYAEGVVAARRAADDTPRRGGWDDPLRTEAVLTYGRLLWWSKAYDQAAAVFETVAKTATSAAAVATAHDWRDRARFSAAQASTE